MDVTCAEYIVLVEPTHLQIATDACIMWKIC